MEPILLVCFPTFAVFADFNVGFSTLSKFLVCFNRDFYRARSTPENRPFFGMVPLHIVTTAARGNRRSASHSAVENTAWQKMQSKQCGLTTLPRLERGRSDGENAICSRTSGKGPAAKRQESREMKKGRPASGAEASPEFAARRRTLPPNLAERSRLACLARK